MNKIERTLTARFDDKADLVVFVIAAKQGTGAHLTEGQKDAALDAAKSVLEIVGAEVVGNSTAFCVTADDFEDGDALSFTAAIEVEKIDGEGEDEDVEEWT